MEFPGDDIAQIFKCTEGDLNPGMFILELANEFLISRILSDDQKVFCTMREVHAMPIELIF
jgi:hypothetical protein